MFDETWKEEEENLLTYLVKYFVVNVENMSKKDLGQQFQKSYFYNKEILLFEQLIHVDKNGKIILIAD